MIPQKSRIEQRKFAGLVGHELPRLERLEEHPARPSLPLQLVRQPVIKTRLGRRGAGFGLHDFNPTNDGLERRNCSARLQSLPAE
jgi:hypothetical protein